MQSITTTTMMTTPQTENISPTERSSFLSKVRSRFVSGRKMSNNMNVPKHAKTSPYTKARSVDLSHQPFASQPAIVNRIPLVVTRGASDDSADTPTSSRGPVSPPTSDRRHSMQGRVVFSLSSPPESKATRSTQSNNIEGLPPPSGPNSIILSSNHDVSAGHTNVKDRHTSSPVPSLPQIQALSPIDVTSTELPSKSASTVSPSIPNSNHTTTTHRDTVIPPPPIGASHSLPAEPKFAPETEDRNVVPPAQSASGPSSAGPSNLRKPMPADIPAILLRRGLSSQAAGINTTMRYDPHSVITEELREDTETTSQPHPLASPYFLGSTPKPPSRLQLPGMATQRGTGLPPLPPLPLPTPNESATPRRPNATTRLRSMPTLARMGADGLQEEDEDGGADHENAMLEEEEEEEEFEDAQESTTETEQSGRDTIRTPGPRMDLAGFRKPSRMLSGFTLGTAGGTVMDATTPKANRLMDYFSIKTPIERKAKTPGVPSTEDTATGKKVAQGIDAFADESDTSTTEDDRDSVAQTPRPNEPPLLPRPISTSSIRPGITHHASKSMVDLLSSRTNRLNDMVGPSASESLKLPPVEGESALRRKEHERDSAAHALKRRSSLPHFTVGSPPPPYPEFGPAPNRFRIVPREDEGRERLPEYENGVHLRAIMPRKLEFSAPGVQSKDRKWRRVLCELEGTAFRVYKCPPSAVGVGPLASWWERRVGVPDVSSDPPARDAAPDTGGGTIDAAGRIRGGATSTTTQTRLEPVPKIGENAPPSATVHPGPPPAPVPVPSPTESRGHSRSVSGSRILFGRKSMGSDATRSSLSVNLVAQAARVSQDSRRSSLSMLSRPSMSSQDSHSSWEEVETPVSTVPEPVPEDLLRTYTLQHAESGLGSDYNKRKNVIRVRLEGEQFLLQAQDVASVVDWIEGLQAATNIALDLDERPMPRGPLFPRRRRRRVRRPDASQGTSGTTNADTTTNSTAGAGAPAT